MYNKNKIRTILFVTALTTATATTSAQAADVVIGEPNWPSAKATAYVLKEVIEQELGMDVEISPGNNAVIFKAMDRGRGDIDVHPEVWLPNQKNLVDTYTGKGTVAVSGNPYDVIQGYCVTRNTMQNHGISSIYDLADPENAKLFDTDGDGKGEVWIGGTGWASTPIEKVRARDYGFAEFFELQELDETLAMAKLDDAVTKDRPFVSYCWMPHQMFKMYDLELLEEPPHDPAKWQMVQPTDDPDWYNKSSISVAWAKAKVHVVWSTTLEQKSSELSRLLSNIKLDGDTINEWIYAVAVDKREAGPYAKEWVKNNQATVRQWTGF